MGIGNMYGHAENQGDPIAVSVASGERATYPLPGNSTGFRIKRGEGSDGTLRYVSRTTDPGDEATTGHTLSATDPDSGWVLADAARFIRVYADGGAVEGEIAPMVVA